MLRWPSPTVMSVTWCVASPSPPLARWQEAVPLTMRGPGHCCLSAMQEPMGHRPPHAGAAGTGRGWCPVESGPWPDQVPELSGSCRALSDCCRVCCAGLELPAPAPGSRWDRGTNPLPDSGPSVSSGALYPSGTQLSAVHARGLPLQPRRPLPSSALWALQVMGSGGWSPVSHVVMGVGSPADP